MVSRRRPRPWSFVAVAFVIASSVACGRTRQGEDGHGRPSTTELPECQPGATAATEPERLEGVVAAWLSRCGHLAYVRDTAGGQELTLREPDQSERVLVQTGRTADSWTWSRRVHFSERGDKLYLSLERGSTASAASLTALDLFTGEQTSLPDAKLEQLVNCLGTDYLVECRGAELVVYDSELQVVARHPSPCDAAWSESRDCKVLVQGAELQIVQLDRKSEPITMRTTALSDLGFEQWLPIPNQPYVVHGAFDQMLCGDTSCSTLRLTELLDLRDGGQVAFSSAAENSLDGIVLQSDPPGKVALLTMATQHLVLDSEERLTELEGVTPRALLRDQATLLANGASVDGNREWDRYRVPHRVASTASLEHQGTLPPGRLSQDERRWAWLRPHAGDVGLRTLVVAPLDSPHDARDIRTVPANMVVSWVGNGDYTLLLAVSGGLPSPGSEDLAEVGFHLLDPEGRVVRFWKREQQPEIHDAAGHVVAILGAGGSETPSATIIDVATGEVISLAGTKRAVTPWPSFSLDSFASRYLLSLDDGFWTGSFGARPKPGP